MLWHISLKKIQKALFPAAEQLPAQHHKLECGAPQRDAAAVRFRQALCQLLRGPASKYNRCASARALGAYFFGNRFRFRTSSKFLFSVLSASKGNNSPARTRSFTACSNRAAYVSKFP